MSSVTLPLRFRALGNEDLAASLVVVNKTISSLQPDQVLIRVTHSSINFMDCGLQRRNIFQLPMPLVLGFDIAGTVVAVGGDESNDIGVGADVMGMTNGGGFAEYIALPRNYVVLRGSVPSAEGSAYGVAFCTAYEGMEIEMNISAHKGKTILIPGAAGGCAHFAVQMAKRAGLRIIGTTSQTAGAELLTKLGVDHVIDYVKQDAAKEVFALTNGNGADLVWDATYTKSSLELSSSLVAKGGLWCILGTAPQLARRGVTDYDGLFKIAQARGATATFSDLGRYLNGDKAQSRPNIRDEVLSAAVRFWNEGTVKPQITLELPFDPVAVQNILDRMFGEKRNVGKVVVKVTSE